MERKPLFPIYPCWNSSGSKPHPPAGFPSCQTHSSSGWTQNDGWQIPTPAAVCIHYNQPLSLIAILINILSEQKQTCSPAPEHFPGGEGMLLWRGQELSLLTPPAFPSPVRQDLKQEPIFPCHSKQELRAVSRLCSSITPKDGSAC